MKSKMEELKPMSEEEMAVVVLGLEYIEEHPEEFPDIEITHF